MPPINVAAANLSLTLLAGLCLAAWGYLLAVHGGFWRADQRLGKKTSDREAWPDVAAIIPARDEAATIGAAVESHRRSAYPGALRVILVDDGSTDGTADLARGAFEDAGRLGEDSGPRRLAIVTAPPLAEGWSGKVAAMDEGLRAAEAEAPDAAFLLFTDADIRHGPDALARLVEKALRDGCALVSLMARLDARGPWAGWLIPAFVYFFQMLYPMRRVNDPTDAMAAAAGGCALVNRRALEEAGGLAPIGAALIDDCALARLIKGEPPARRIWLGHGTTVVSGRDNRSLGSIWSMVARTAFTQLNYSADLLTLTVLGLALVFLAGPLAFLTAPLHGDVLAMALGGAAWAAMALSFGPTLRLYGKPSIDGLLLPAAAALYLAMTISSALNHWRGEGGRWKGRTYARPDAEN
ncbi:MAG: glycosyltransferase [Pseudomonadota bacterium]